ncbi:hypothetical protein T484DRAFT_1934450 [Baffinella frigidus]|nr:hypothetical protein T484DRAFT_1934450 [Cryptophyta sp. CCMP2293]
MHGGGFLGALVSSFEDPKEWERLAWALDSVDPDAPVTKSALFDSVLADRINRGREALKGKRVVVEKQRENAQTDLDAAEVWSEESRKTRDALQGEADLAKANPRKKALPKEHAGKLEAAVHEAAAAAATAAVRRGKVKDLEGEEARLLEEEDALDFGKELEALDGRARAEVEAAEEEREAAAERAEADPTPEAAEALAEATDRVGRVAALWKLRRQQRVKEVEIEVLGQKMADDEARIHLEGDRLRQAFRGKQEESVSSLASTLRDMENSIKETARGRCRPEVMAGMRGVQKLRDAVDRHRMASLTAEQVERQRVVIEEAAEKEKEAVTKQKAEEAAELKKSRATTDLTARERHLQQVEEAVMEKKKQILARAVELVASATKAVEGSAGDFSAQHTLVDIVDAKPGPAAKAAKPVASNKHAKELLAEGKKALAELSGALDSWDGGESDVNVKAECGEAVAKADALGREVDAAEVALLSAVEEAQVAVDALLRKDLASAVAAAASASDISSTRIKCTALIPRLDALRDVTVDAAIMQGGVSGRKLALAEQKLRLGWTRLAPKLDASVRGQLSAGDRSLDTVTSALAGAELKKAVLELKRAKESYSSAKSATSAVEAPAPP